MQVFISHSRHNSSAALKLCDRLNVLGVATWLDLREIDTGMDWNAQVAQAIQSAEGFVFLIGPPGPPDQGQRFEWLQITEHEFYLDPARPLIPIVIGGAELPGFLRTRQALHLEETDIDFDVLANTVSVALLNPADTIDAEKLEQGRAARQHALENLREYSRDLEEADVKQAALRELK